MFKSIDTLVSQFERHEINRRQLIGALAATIAATGNVPASAASPIVLGHQINHVAVGVKDVNRSKAFYEQLFGVQVRHDGTRDTHSQRFYDLGLAGASFITIVEGPTPGAVHHMCVGVERFDIDKVTAALKETFPDRAVDSRKTSGVAGKPLMWPSVYLNDPDGARIQIGDVKFQLDGRR